MSIAYRLLNKWWKARNDSKLIIVVGDAMTDIWMHGHFEPCQDMCNKFVVEERYETPGGAANAVDCAKTWSTRVELYSALDSLTWTRKTRLVDPSGRIVSRIDEDNYGSLSNWSRRSLLESIPYAGACLLSDYDKGTLAPDLIRTIIEMCARNITPCIVDAKRPPPLYTGALLKCNATYSHRWSGAGDVVTDGSRPPIVGGKRIDIDLPPVECINHVGAGDCFAIHLALGLANGLSLEEAATLAHSAGRVYVQRSRRYPVTPEEISRDVNLGVSTVPRNTPQASQNGPQGDSAGRVVGAPQEERQEAL